MGEKGNPPPQDVEEFDFGLPTLILSSLLRYDGGTTYPTRVVPRQEFLLVPPTLLRWSRDTHVFVVLSFTVYGLLTLLLCFLNTRLSLTSSYDPFCPVII